MKTHMNWACWGILAAILVGCRHSSDKMKTAEASVSGNTVSLAEASLDIPTGWKVFDMTKRDFAKAMEAWVAANPEAKRTAEAVKGDGQQQGFSTFRVRYHSFGTWVCRQRQCSCVRENWAGNA